MQIKKEEGEKIEMVKILGYLLIASGYLFVFNYFKTHLRKDIKLVKSILKGEDK